MRGDSRQMFDYRLFAWVEYLNFLSRAARATATRDANGYIIYGKYTKDGNILHLENFGTLEIVYNGDIITGFKLTPAGASVAIPLGVEKEEQQESDALNNQLCRTWNMVSIREVEYLNGKKTYDVTSTPEHPYVPGDNGEMEEVEDFPLQVLFSKSGTYLVYYKDGTVDVAEWKWKDKAEKTVYYDWSDNWEDDTWFILRFAGNRVTVTSEYTYTEDEGTYKYYNESILEAVN